MGQQGKTYGLPYKGSKRKLVGRIMRLLPKADTLVDVFCGGCSMAHYALEHDKYKHVLINDINKGMQELFVDAISGKYRDGYDWVSREQFNMFKDSDAFIGVCWSFGNNMSDYLYSKDNERLREKIHAMLYSKDENVRYEYYLQFMNDLVKLVKDIRREDKQKTGWKKKLRRYEKNEKYPKGLKEKNLLEWQLGMLRQEVMRPLVDYMCNAFERSGLTKKDIDENLGSQMSSHYFTRGSQWALPKEEDWNILMGMINLKKTYKQIHEEYKRKQEKLSFFKFIKYGRTDNELILESLYKLSHIVNINIVKGMEMPADRVGRLKISNVDYQSVVIPKDAVIYADPPYKGTDGYTEEEFDHERFYRWAESQDVPVFISEYCMPEDRFRCIAEFDKVVTFSANSREVKKEKLFIPIKQEYRETKDLF